MERDIQCVLLSETQIREKVQELAQRLLEEYSDKNPIFVGVLKGVAVFFADMIRQFTAPCQIDFMWISSYSGTTSKETLVRKDVTVDLKGRHVVILEDIFDTGNSLQYTYEHLLSKEPASLKICTLLDKPEGRRPGITVKADYTGFSIPNEFVVGYGLDFNEHYRNLPFVGILSPKAYEK